MTVENNRKSSAMNRPQSALQGARADAKRRQPPNRGASAGVRHAVVQDAPRDEMEFYMQQLNELADQRSKLERDYQQRCAANRQSIRKMHDENTLLRAIRAESKDVTAAELEQLERCKFIEVRRLNRLTHQLEKLEGAIKEAEESRRIHDHVLNVPSVESVNGNRTVVLRIKKLEKLLDRVLSEQQCIMNIRRMYTAMLEEVRKEGNDREACVLVMEHDIDARLRDYAKLVVMYNNANSDYQTIRETLRKFKEKFQETRRVKDKTLGERRQRLEQILRETRQLELSEVKLHQEIEDEHHRIEEAETERQTILQRRRRSVSAMERLSMVKVDDQQPTDDNNRLLQTFGGSPEEEERVRAYEESFRKMMRATESATIDELMTKFETEYAARLQLQEQSRSEKARLDRVSAEVQHLKDEAEQLRICGVNELPVTAMLRDELLVCIEDASRKRDETIQRSMELQQVLAEVIRRVDVLAASVMMYRPEVCVPPTTSDNLVANLKLVVAKIFSLADDVVSRDDNNAMNVDALLVMVPPGNTRVLLPSRCDESSEGEYSGYGIVPSSCTQDVRPSVVSSVSEEEEDAREDERTVALLENEDPLSREQIKRLAAVVLRREARRRQLEKRRR